MWVRIPPDAPGPNEPDEFFCFLFWGKKTEHAGVAKSGKAGGFQPSMRGFDSHYPPLVVFDTSVSTTSKNGYVMLA